MDVSKVQSIQRAHDKYKAAGEAYQAAIRAEYPVGCTVMTRWKDGWTGPYEVTGYRPVWSQPDYIDVNNLRTGKVRSVWVKDVIHAQGA